MKKGKTDIKKTDIKSLKKATENLISAAEAYLESICSYQEADLYVRKTYGKYTDDESFD